jgi:hypothetical protein
VDDFSYARRTSCCRRRQRKSECRERSNHPKKGDLAAQRKEFSVPTFHSADNRLLVTFYLHVDSALCFPIAGCAITLAGPSCLFVDTYRLLHALLAVYLDGHENTSRSDNAPEFCAASATLPAARQQ